LIELSEFDKISNPLSNEGHIGLVRVASAASWDNNWLKAAKASYAEKRWAWSGASQPSSF